MKKLTFFSFVVSLCLGLILIAFQSPSAAANPSLPGQLNDLDGDGKADLIVWRTTNGGWYALLSTRGYASNGPFYKKWGDGATDVPLLGDLDGDRKSDLIVWRTTNGGWYACLSSRGYATGNASFYKKWGNGATDIPLLGDLDGDGKSDLIVWRTTNGSWYALLSSRGYAAGDASFYKKWGNGATDIPLLGDLDGDGKSDLIVWRTTNGGWYALLSSRGYAAGNASFYKKWGDGIQDEPQLGIDIDGDGRLDPTVWRRSDGHWWALKSSKGYYPPASFSKKWGNSYSDVTIPYESLHHRVSAIALTTFFNTFYAVSSEETTYLPWPGGHTWRVTQGRHQGWAYDFAPNSGQSPLAVAVRSGKVVEVVDGIPDEELFCSGFAGNAIVIKHDESSNPNEGLFSAYFHLKRGTSRVSEGDDIGRGTVIAERGNSGYSFGAHLHFVMLRKWHLHSLANCSGSRIWTSVGGYSTPVHFDDGDPDLVNGEPRYNTYLTSSNVPQAEEYSATWHSQSGYPTVSQGGRVDLWVKYRNTGNTTWHRSSPNRTLLGTLHPDSGAIDYHSPFVCSSWIGDNRPAVLEESSVGPGGIGTFRFPICVPSSMASGTYRLRVAPLVEDITWMLQSNVFWNVTVTPGSCPGQYRAEYYNNRYLSGSPTFVQCEPWPINHDWGNGGPGNSVGNDNFSARWTGRAHIAEGTYTFIARTDDGMRVWIGDNLIIDAWWDQPATEYRETRHISDGYYDIKVEYYENGGGAVAQFRWEQASACDGPAVSLNQTVSGNIGSPGEQDSYCLTVGGGQWVSIRMVGCPEWTTCGLDTYLEVYNLDGSRLAWDDDGFVSGKLHSFLSAWLPGAGTYRIVARGYGSTTGEYALRVESGRAAAVGDINKDCTINGVDASIMMSRFGSSDPEADLDLNGIVNTLDNGILQSNWGKTCTAGATKSEPIVNEIKPTPASP